MREIKFRAWGFVTERMYGPFDIFDYSDAIALSESAGTTAVYPYSRDFKDGDAVLMQYTGLKDKSGKEIYEGDILKYHAYCNLDLDEEESIGKVTWGETGDSDGWAHGSHLEWTIEGDSLADIYPQAEVIGNIYENPELISK